MYYVYLITNKKNGKGYVGYTSVGVKERWKGHKKAARNGSEQAIHRAIRKYGPNSFSISALGKYRKKEVALKAEVEFIDSLGTLENGYNMTPGGDCPPIIEMTPELKNKLRKASGTPVVIDGKKFLSLKQAADHYGVHRNTISRWVDDYDGKSVDPLEMRRGGGSAIFVDGRRYKSVRHAAESLGVKTDAIYMRIHRGDPSTYYDKPGILRWIQRKLF